MIRCANCQSTIVFGSREFAGRPYCSSECVQFSRTPDFCDACKSVSLAVDAGHIVSVNFIGRGFLGRSNPCPHCNSDERYLAFFIGIPILPLGKWKVKATRPRRIITRKIGQTAFPDIGTHRTYSAEENRRWNRKLIYFGVAFVVVVNVLIRLFMWWTGTRFV